MTNHQDFTMIYIDESGNLGFDFSKTGTTKHLIITGLMCGNISSSQMIGHAIKKTRSHENKRNKKSSLSELKGSKTSLALKQYFLKNIRESCNWNLYSIIANKRSWLYENKSDLSPENFYDMTLLRLLKSMPLASVVHVIIDRSKSSRSIEALNECIAKEFKGSNIKFIIKHDHSYKYAGLQAVDLFCWGIARKYEYGDLNWYKLFRDRILCELEA